MAEEQTKKDTLNEYQLAYKNKRYKDDPEYRLKIRQYQKERYDKRKLENPPSKTYKTNKQIGEKLSEEEALRRKREAAMKSVMDRYNNDPEFRRQWSEKQKKYREKK